MTLRIKIPFMQYGQKTRLVLLSVAGLLLGMMLLTYHAFSKNQTVSLQNKRSELIVQELSTIQSQLDVFLGTAKNQKSQSALLTIQNALSALQQSILTLAKTADMQQVSSQIASVKDDVDSQMGDIKQVILNHPLGKQYLTAEALPFHVVSVDRIAGLPYVSVEYAKHISPLAVGDNLAGWRVIAAYFDAGVAEFMNDKEQYVKVVIQNDE
jgi:hypothetical protein